MLPPIAVLVREVSASYPTCIRTGVAPISLSAARAQHAAYVAAVEGLGARVQRLPVLDEQPDAVFVEDTAVILVRSAVITRPGAAARRGETASVADALRAWCDLVPMSGPATLDGGDVLRAGKYLFVGLSARTNAEGFELLAAVARREGIDAVAVPVERALHLKSACSLADDSTLVLDRTLLDPRPFAAAGLEVIEVDEPAGANVLAIGETVFASSAAPRTVERLVSRGLRVHVLDVSEFHAGDGALTCLSLRVPAPGAWAT